VSIWDAASGAKVRSHTLAGGPVTFLTNNGPASFSPDGRWLALAGGGTLKVMDTETGAELSGWSDAQQVVSDVANVMAEQQWKNMRIAETEKYAHVTYFFNGGNENSYRGEEREMVQSPRVATYDLMPQMSAAGIAKVAVKSIESKDFDVIIMNFANADMVGHSGQLGPTVKAVEMVDSCLGEIYGALRRTGGKWVITADHGNAELMIDPITKGPHTYHTTNPVPFIVVDEEKAPLQRDGSLRDIAPTMLAMLGVSPSKDMSGRDLRSKK